MKREFFKVAFSRKKRLRLSSILKKLKLTVLSEGNHGQLLGSGGCGYCLFINILKSDKQMNTCLRLHQADRAIDSFLPGALRDRTRSTKTGTVAWLTTFSVTLPITQAISPVPWVAIAIKSKELSAA